MNTIADITNTATSELTITLVQKLLFLQDDSHYEFVSHSLSKSSISGIISKDIKEGNKITVELSFNDDIEFIQAVVESTENTNQELKHKVFCKFIDLTTQQKKLLDKMIGSYNEKHLASAFSKHIKKEYDIEHKKTGNNVSTLGIFTIITDLVILGLYLLSLPVGQYYWQTLLGQTFLPEWETYTLLGTLYIAIINVILISSNLIKNILNKTNASKKWRGFLIINMLLSVGIIALSAYTLF